MLWVLDVHCTLANLNIAAGLYSWDVHIWDVPAKDIVPSREVCIHLFISAQTPPKLTSPKGHLRSSVPIRMGYQSYQNFHPSFLQAYVCTFHEKNSPLFRMGHNSFLRRVHHIYDNWTHHGVQVTSSSLSYLPIIDKHTDGASAPLELSGISRSHITVMMKGLSSSPPL
jgi:hypothetical protein